MVAWLRSARRKPGTIRVRRQIVWRIARKPDAWIFIDWQYAMGGRFGGRWDSPSGDFRTIYSAADVYGSALEVLAHFRPDPEVARVLAGIETSSTDVPTVSSGEVPQEWLMDHCIGRGFLYGTYLSVTNSKVIALLRNLLRRDIDASDLKSAEKRSLTQEVAGHVHKSLDVDGIEYFSRHGEEARLFAVFEKDTDTTHSSNVRDIVTRDIHPSSEGLVRAMDTLGLVWAKDETLPGPIMEEASDEEIALACFPPDGVPRVTDPLGVAFLWLSALDQNDLDVLDILTWKLSAWNLGEAREMVNGRGLKQKVEWPAEDGCARDDIAYVCLVRGLGGVAWKGAFLGEGDVVWLTTVKAKDRWFVWGIGEWPASTSMVRL